MPHKYRKTPITALILVLLISLATPTIAEDVTFDETLAKYRYQTSQPFSGSMGFVSPPKFGKSTKLRLELTSHENLDTLQTFEIINLGSRTAEFSPSTLTWEPPIDSGATRSFEVEFHPGWVGGYEVLISRKLPYNLQDLGRIMLIFDEDGNLVCQGALTDCGTASIPLHPHREAETLHLPFPTVPVRKSQPVKRDFSADFVFLSEPVLGDTTYIEVSLESQRNLYREVQFVAEHSTNLKIAEMPESWGNSIGLHPDYRYFTDTLSLILLRDGLSYLDFQVVGRHPHALRGNHITTSFPIYFVTTKEEGLIFLGDFEPITRYSSVNEALLGSLQQLPDAGSPDFRTKYTLSKPDFRAAADSAASDTTGANEQGTE